MQTRSGVDGQHGAATIVEWKSIPRTRSPVRPIWLSSVVPPGRRWWHLLPLGLLFILCAVVPGFFTALAILLASLATALSIFVLLVQLPVGYLFHCWRDRRRIGDAQRPAQRGATSKGL